MSVEYREDGWIASEVQVSYATLMLAAKVAKLLTDNPEACVQETSYGNFYATSVELNYSYGGDHEVVGHLRPDEASGDSWDLWVGHAVRGVKPT